LTSRHPIAQRTGPKFDPAHSDHALSAGGVGAPQTNFILMQINADFSGAREPMVEGGAKSSEDFLNLEMLP
jgi:hypothetical protein